MAEAYRRRTGWIARAPSDAVRPLGRAEDLVLSPDEVRVRLAQAAERQRVSAAESDRAKRDGVAVAAAMAEMCRAMWHGEGRDANPWTWDFQADTDAASERCGLTRARTGEAQDALVAAGVCERREVEGARTYRFAEGLWTPHSVSASVDWDQVRAQIRQAGGALPSGLAVLREIARVTPAVGEHVSISLSELARRAWFSETVVDGALRSLIAAGLLERMALPRRVSQYRLTEAVFGGQATSAAPMPPLPVSESQQAISAQMPAPPEPPQVLPTSSPTAQSVTRSGFVLLLGGGELSIPAGMRVEVTGRDAQGRPVIAIH